MINFTARPRSVDLVVLDDVAARAYAHSLLAAGVPFAVVAARESLLQPFAAAGHVVALVADIDDPDQLAGVIGRVEQRLAPVGAVVRYRADVPPMPELGAVA
ncbi:MAG: hypothetical protein QM728_04010 [Gordonia sp. (in: high G+C Gram-positive bacteria)]|uniref:hypothetical protein n=1 Tax=Gordonia sp. (in: high G+C Gram-positive bacteria) TaxID=84139 RepID=UPI0039E3FC99